MSDLKNALKAYEDERYYNNGRIPDWVHTLASAAKGILPKHLLVMTADSPEDGLAVIRDAYRQFPGWEADIEQEGGQPNGGGEIESNDSREWFHPDGETHHRAVITITGPWVDGPTNAVRIRREEQARRKAAREAELAAQRLVIAPQELLLDVAKGLYGAHRLQHGLEHTPTWYKLTPGIQEEWLEQARRIVDPSGPTSEGIEEIVSERSAEDQADTIDREADHG